MAPGETRVWPDDGRVRKAYRNQDGESWLLTAEKEQNPQQNWRHMALPVHFLGRLRRQTGPRRAAAGGRWWRKRIEENLLVILCENAALRAEPGSIGPCSSVYLRREWGSLACHPQSTACCSTYLSAFSLLTQTDKNLEMWVRCCWVGGGRSNGHGLWPRMIPERSLAALEKNMLLPESLFRIGVCEGVLCSNPGTQWEAE